MRNSRLPLSNAETSTNPKPLMRASTRRKTEMRRYLAVAGLLAAVFFVSSQLPMYSEEPRSPAEMRFDEVVQSPLELRSFLHAMPKGADLHYHLIGGAYAENLIKSGARKGSCIDVNKLAASPPPCDAGHGLRPISDALQDADLNRKIVDAWSMRGFVADAGFTGHDQFFRSFGLFGNAVDPAVLVSEVSNRAAEQRLAYIELMISLQTQAIDQIASNITWTEDFDGMLDKLSSLGIERIVEDAIRDLDDVERQRTRILKCGQDKPHQDKPDPGCNTEVRYLMTTNRTLSPALVFAQTVFGFMLAKKDSQVVGINFVGPEDNPVALADYSLHMRMLNYLESKMPNVNVALHAGELTLGLVTPEQLSSHIREAVVIGGARRVGHGVDIMYEDRPYELLQTLADRHIAVEIALTSNRLILGVAGKQHPFPVYRHFNVPLVIATDDEGVSRTDMTNELVTAVTSYGLTYGDVISLQRNSLEYSFLPGQSLWEDTSNWRPALPCRTSPKDQPSSACLTLLKSSKKAELEWNYERSLEKFNGVGK
jgi:adenosine deaminase